MRRLQHAKTLALRQVDHVRSAKKIENALVSGSVPAFEITAESEYRRLIEEHPVGDTVAQSLRHQLHIIGKARRHVTIRPSAGISESLRQVPVVKRYKRPDMRLKQRIDDA